MTKVKLKRLQFQYTASKDHYAELVEELNEKGITDVIHIDARPGVFYTFVDVIYRVNDEEVS